MDCFREKRCPGTRQRSEVHCQRHRERQNGGMRWRRVAVIAGILVVAGGIGAVSWGLLAYNQVTKIDRSNPKVVTDEYLRAALVRKDKAGADLYACEDQSKLAPIKALRDELDQRERDFGVKILVDWVEFNRSDQGRSALLTTNLSISGLKDGNVTSRRQETWRFTLADDGGWRVCGAEKVESLPT